MTTFIAITGTHSTGKTTFANHLKELCKERELRVAIVKDNAQACKDEGFGILKHHTFESTLWIMATVIREEQKASLNSDVVIVDRAVSDAIGYLEAALATSRRSITQDQRNYLISLAKLHAPRYQLLYKTILDEDIELGQGRDPDLAFRKDVDRRIDQVIADLGLSSLNPITPEGVSCAVTLLDSIAVKSSSNEQT